MSDIKWIKITTNIFDDEKIRLIETLPDSDTIIVIWFKLLTMAGRCNDSGLIYLTRDIPYNEEMLSTILRRPINTIRLALKEFCNLGMIEIEDNFIAILNWEKHQNIDGLEKIKEQSRIRQQKHREKQKITKSNVTVTLSNAIDKNRIEENREDKNIYTNDDIHRNDLFNQWWDIYCKPIEKDRCFKYWCEHVKPGLYTEIIKHTMKYVESRPDPFYRKDPFNYLEKKIYNDGVIKSKELSPKEQTQKTLQEMGYDK